MRGNIAILILFWVALAYLAHVFEMSLSSTLVIGVAITIVLGIRIYLAHRSFR